MGVETMHAIGIKAIQGAADAMFQALEEYHALRHALKLSMRFPKRWGQGPVQFQEVARLIVTHNGRQYWITPHPDDLGRLASLPPRLRMETLQRMREVTRWCRKRIAGLQRHRQECLRQQAHLYTQLQTEDAEALLFGDTPFDRIPAQYWGDYDWKETWNR